MGRASQRVTFFSVVCVGNSSPKKVDLNQYGHHNDLSSHRQCEKIYYFVVANSIFWDARSHLVLPGRAHRQEHASRFFRVVSFKLRSFGD